MNWISLSLLANVFFTFTNIFDKYFNAKRFKNVYSFSVLLNLIYFIFILITTVVFWSRFTFGWHLLYASIAGFLYFFMWIFYWKGLQGGEVSRASAIFFTQPFFNAILAVVFLGESLPIVKWLGIMMIVLGGVLSSVDKNGFGKIKKSYIYVIIAAIISAIANIIFKQSTSVMTGIEANCVSFWATLPIYLGLLLKKEIFIEVKKNVSSIKELGLMFVRGLIGYLAILAFVSALSIGPVSLVAALNGAQPLFILVASIIISVFYPKIFKEELSKSAVVNKIIAVTMIVAGALIVSL